MAAEDGMEQAIRERARAVRGLFLDVDGVLTDGSFILDNNGVEIKAFNVKDGIGIRMLLRAGVRVALISGRSSPAVKFRAQDLGIDEVHQGVNNKIKVFRSILKKWNIKEHQAAFVGDDIPDLPLLERVGLAVAVADACSEVKERAHMVTGSKGGRGAVREVSECILRARGAWNPLGNA